MAALPDVPKLVRDAVFLSVGLGLLGVNQIQVARRELTADLKRMAGSGPLGLVLGGGRPGGRPGEASDGQTAGGQSGEQTGEQQGEQTGGRADGHAGEAPGDRPAAGA